VSIQAAYSSGLEEIYRLAKVDAHRKTAAWAGGMVRRKTDVIAVISCIHNFAVRRRAVWHLGGSRDMRQAKKSQHQKAETEKYAQSPQGGTYLHKYFLSFKNSGESPAKTIYGI